MADGWDAATRGDNRGQALVIGAGGGIGGAVTQRWAQSGCFSRVHAVSRGGRGWALDAAGAWGLDPADAEQPGGAGREPSRDAAIIRHAVPTDGDEEALAEHIRSAAQAIASAAPDLRRVVIALGTLHGEGYGPEKSLDALDAQAMSEVYRINCVLPLLWVAALGRALRHSGDCRIAVLSARVGSIGDNQLGGWYSYRCAKAALNMGLKSAAVELARRAKGVKLVAYHPGTVATPLSRPFQRGVPEGKLFTPAFAARCLDEVLDGHSPDGALSFVDWAGKTIPW